MFVAVWEIKCENECCQAFFLFFPFFFLSKSFAAAELKERCRIPDDERGFVLCGYACSVMGW